MMHRSQTLPTNTWVVMPAYNEATYIKRVLEKVLKYTSNIIVVDDGSRDNTASQAQELVEHVLVHQVNLGKGAALKTGCEFAFSALNAKAVIIMDSDDQHDPALLSEFSHKLETGCEIVFGVRDFKGMPAVRKISNRLGSVIIKTLFGKYIDDIPSGYKAFTNHAYRKLAWYSRDYSVEMEIAARTAKYKLPYSEIIIPTIYHDFNRGMTMLDSLGMIGRILSWRISL